ncbi:MAG: type II secretion system protein GspD [Lentisphaerae bacterium]|nr:type II secretion system protein GspD [Lentisphaerota bacterium]
MRKLLITLAFLGASFTYAQETENPTISKALENLFNKSTTEANLPEEKPLYLKIVPSQTSDRSTLIYRCRYIKAKSIIDSIESATSPTGTVETSDEQNIITINDENAQLNEIQELLLSLDIPTPQVLVEAEIIEVQMGNGSEWDAGLSLGYDGSSAGALLGGMKGYPLAGALYPTENGTWIDIVGDIQDNVDINARLRWLENNDKAEILSSPNLLVDLGTTATVSTGTDQPLLNVSVNNGVSQESVYYKRTGVNLRVTPQLINKDTVTLQVCPEVTSVVGYATLSASSEPPIISVRNIDTKLNVKDGGVVMMGGLYSSKDIESEERVPILSSIPFIGRLFRSTTVTQEQVQLIFLLKVTIVPDSLETVLNNLDTSKQDVKGASEVLRNMMAPEATEE